MPLYDRFKRRDPSPKEQANWDALMGAEKEKQKQERQEADRRLNKDAAARKFDQFRFK